VRVRELVAALVVLVGGSLWLVLPDKRPAPGSLRDDSPISRWKVRPGPTLAAWVLVENRGPQTITLTGASLGRPLPEGARLLGVRARIGEVATIEHAFPGPPGPFLRLEGFRIPPRRGATVGFGLQLDRAGLVRLEDARVRYREDGEDHELRARHTARLCVVVSLRGC
jgi:hypothetical protein